MCAAWWYKPEHIINELNVNSVITTPCHEEILPINSWTTQRPYTLRGYAYSGECLHLNFVFYILNKSENCCSCFPSYYNYFLLLYIFRSLNEIVDKFCTKLNSGSLFLRCLQTDCDLMQFAFQLAKRQHMIIFGKNNI